MEPIRPKVDAFLLDWLRRALLQRKWFFRTKGRKLPADKRICHPTVGNLSKLEAGRRALCGMDCTHALVHVAIVASEGSGYTVDAKPKREGKGIPTSAPIMPMVPAGRSLTAPKLVRLTVHDPIAQARRSEAQRRQVAALQAWNPSDKPKWLDEKTYLEKIQPRLVGIEIPVLMSVLGISTPYATAIRAGRRPHPRHWVNLAHLTGSHRKD